MESGVAPDGGSYDNVPYPGRAYPQTHPDRLATIATLFGLAPAAVERCRVLELGCGDAANLLPMAYTMPHARFVGVDLASSPIERGRHAARVLGLTNLELDRGDLCDLPEDLGRFDYIIAHGLYSWIPSAVRDRLMEVVRRHLAPDGVAFISYHVYPGFYARRMLREMLLFRLQGITDPAERLRESMAFCRALATVSLGRDTDTSALFGRAVKRLEDADAAVFLHDDLAPVNEACYFLEFVGHASSHELQFLAEADLFEMLDDLAPDELKPELRALADTGDVVRREQLLDFCKGRQFRQSLLCHADRRLDAASAPGRVSRLWAAASLTMSDVDGGDSSNVRFVSPRGPSVTTSEPFTKSALALLADRYPERVVFDELLLETRARAGPTGHDPESEREHLANVLWQCFSGAVISLHTCPAPVVRMAGPRPEVSAVARLQARTDVYVSSLVHTTVRIEDAGVRQLLPLLDGTRDRAAVCHEWSALLRANSSDNAERLNDDSVGSMLEESLNRLGKIGLFVR